MKTVIIILFLSTLLFQSSFGQKDLSGIYLNENGTRIEIKDDKFVYIEPHTHSPIWYNDTLAECSVKRVNDQFIELSSIPPYIIAQRGLRVIQSSDPTIKDSIKVSFSIPYQRHNLDVFVSNNTFKTFDLSYSQNNRELMLPVNTKTITFSISPGLYLTPHSVDGLYYGVLYYSSAEYIIEKNVNHVEVAIPAIDDSFFEKYYVKGDYAKVEKDTIIWKGEFFIKKK